MRASLLPTGHLSKFDTVPVEIQRPGLKYIYPDEDWYRSLLRGEVAPKDCMALLRGMGVNLEELAVAIRQLFLKIALPFSPHKSSNIRAAEIADILKRCSSSDCFHHPKVVLSSSRRFRM